LPMDQVLMELLDLEVQGTIVAVPGGFIRVT
jgi:predicted Rossmann fold nucleotide-binding protein DprA/Smf involved in DNA uptake